MSTALNWGQPCLAPAKLNLFLHVVGQRADGYHLLQTVFRFLDHGDVLRFEPRADGQIQLANPIPGVPDEDNLCVRAARLLQAHAGVAQGVTIHLDKRLPMGGGLGGGSSDAATVLLALNQLWQAHLSRPALQALGLQLGADVPVFVFGRSAFAEGIGEHLQPCDLPPAWYVVLEPPVAVPTPLIFKSPDLCRNTPILRAEDWSPGMGHNDLEPVACAQFPIIAAYRDGLSAFAPARMTGSGACVFAEFATRAAAETALAALPKEWHGWVAAGLDRHPLECGCD